MKKQKPYTSVLFVSYDLSRDIILLARNMRDTGLDVTLATPKCDNEKYLLDIPHIRIGTFRFFKYLRLLKNKKLREFAARPGLIIHALDMPSYKLVRTLRRDRNSRAYYSDVDFGLDLKVWTPGAVSILRQTNMLSQYNIAPHQKLITVISPLGEGLPNLLSALSEINRDDVIIALCGCAAGVRAKKIVNMTRKSGMSDKIIYTGGDMDMPTLMRASFAVMSLCRHDRRMLKFGTAMGRVTMWNAADSDIKPTIDIKENTPAELRDCIIKALDMPTAKRANAERQNCKTAKNFSIDKTLQDCLELYGG